MNAAAFAHLAVPRTVPDRRRWLLVAGACAATVTLVLAGLRIVRYPLVSYEFEGSGAPPVEDYATYILEDGLRSGTLFGVLLWRGSGGLLRRVTCLLRSTNLQQSEHEGSHDRGLSRHFRMIALRSPCNRRARARP